MENDVAYVHNRKAVLALDRLRWLEIIEMFYNLYKEYPRPEYKEMMKFCGQESQWCKTELSKLK